MRVIVLSLITFAIFIFVKCGSDNNGQVSSVETDTNRQKKIANESPVDRAAAILECAKCHQEAYENWLIGPHANAYKSLMEHVHYVETAETFSDDYRGFIKERFTNVCVSCHSGQNLYDNNFRGLEIEPNSDDFIPKYYPEMYKRAFQIKLREEEELMTGVDCLTCHQSGKDVVTKGNYSGKGMGETCNLIASKFFSTNDNCFTCHFHQVESSQRIAKNFKLKEKNCNSCHMEYAEDGHATHYYFWRKDSETKTRPASLGMFASVQADIKTIGEDLKLTYSWNNDYIPHEFSECGEAVLIIQVLNKTGKLVEERTERINNKKSFEDKKDIKHFHEGIEGNQFRYKLDSIEGKIDLNKTLSGGKVVLKGMIKPQYWSTEKELKQVFFKEIKIK